MHGKGTFTWPTGSYYTGDWQSNKKTGKGEMHCKGDNSTYVGDWLNDQRHGEGKMTWIKEGKEATYTGGFMEDLKHGRGEY